MKFSENRQLNMLKIIIIIVGYIYIILNDFTTHITIFNIVDDGKINYKLQILKPNSFFEKK